MRKALGGGSRKSRRRRDDGGPMLSGDDNASRQSDSTATTTSTGDGSSSNKRKPTQDEAVLTAKNYRLAKELSELRVRHREETKNVTRLTMENMNLASKCREAIAQVSSLKKELAMHQRRTQGALAAQRQTLVNSSSEDRAEEMERMDSLMASVGNNSAPSLHDEKASSSAVVATAAASASRKLALSSSESRLMMNRYATNKPPPPPPPPPPKRQNGLKTSTQSLSVARSNSESPTEEDMFLDFDTAGDNDSFVAATTTRLMSRRSGPIDIASPDDFDTDDFAKSMFPNSASPQISGRKSANYNEGFPDDLPVLSHAVRSNSRKLMNDVFRATSPGIVETDEASLSSQTSDMSGSRGPRSSSRYLSSSSDKENTSGMNGDSRGSSTMSSIDVFEASFDTAFPNSFSHSSGAFSDARGKKDLAKLREEEPGKEGEEKDADKKRRTRIDTYDPFSMSPMKSPNSNAGSGSTIRPRTDPPAKHNKTTTATASSPGTYGSVGTATHSPRRERTASPSTSRPHRPSPRHSPETSKPVLTASTHSLSADSTSMKSSSPSASRKSLRNSMERFNSGSSSSLHSTPEKPQRKAPSPPSTPETPKNSVLSNDVEQPRRPEKPASASARARYEKALQPRSFTPRTRSVGRLRDSPNRFLAGSDGEEGTATSTRESSTPENKGNASANSNGNGSNNSNGNGNTPVVLKRLQQRRVKDRLTSSSSTLSDDGSSVDASELTSSSNGSNISKDTISGMPSRSETRRRLSQRVSAHLDGGRDPVFRRSSSGRIYENDSAMQRRSFSSPGGREGDSASGAFEEDELMGNEETYDGDSFLAKKSISPEKAPVRNLSSGRKPLSPESMSKEISALDSLASSTASASASAPPPPTSDAANARFRAARTHVRRNVQQPISYSEPSLNAKLRQGDSYFQKSSVSSVSSSTTTSTATTAAAVNSSNNKDVPSTTVVSPDAMVGEVSGEDVLKDLAATTSSRVGSPTKAMI